jgi:aminopeptidase N
MIHTLLGSDNFRKGMDLYFERHDGQAVTTEEFVSAMEDASKVDLTRFRRWYQQAGTPEVTVTEEYDSAEKVYRLTLSQKTPATPGQDEKLPFHLPVKLSLMDSNGDTLPLEGGADSTVLNLLDEEQTFRFDNIEQKPVLSILQGYSAPVKLHFERDDEELAFCMAHESDDFNRWEAGQQLSTRLLLSMVKQINAGKAGELSLPDYYIDACRKTLNDRALDKALVARALTLPSLTYIGEMMPVIDVDAIHQAREFTYCHLAESLKDDFVKCYQANSQDEYSLSPASMGERFLRGRHLPT